MYCLNSLDTEGKTYEYKKELYGKLGQAFSSLGLVLEFNPKANKDLVKRYLDLQMWPAFIYNN